MPSYTIRSGDSLAKIARRAGINLLDLVAANPRLRDPDLIMPGQRIQLPTKSFGAQQRNVAAERIASGSYSAGTFSVTGVPGEGLREIGEFYRGPGGGYGAAAQGLNLQGLFEQDGGAPFVSDLVEPATGEAPQLTKLEFSATQLANFAQAGRDAQITPAISPEFQAQLESGTVGLEDILPKDVMDRLRKRPRSERFGVIRGARRRGDKLIPRQPIAEGGPQIRTGRVVDKADIPLDIEAIRKLREARGIRQEGEGQPEVVGGVPLSRFSPDMTNAEREAIVGEMVSNGVPFDEAVRLAFGTEKGPFEIGTIIDFTKVRQNMVAGQIYTALGGEPDPTHPKSVQAQEIMDQITTRYLPTSMTQRQVNYMLSLIERGMEPDQAIQRAVHMTGFKATSTSSPEAIDARVNTEPAEVTTDEMIHRWNNPITLGEKKFTLQNSAQRPDVLLGMQQNWDMNVAITAGTLMSEGMLRPDEIGEQVKDGIAFLGALADGELWAMSIIEKALHDPRISGVQSDNLMRLLGLMNTDPDALREFSDITTKKEVEDFLTEQGWERNVGDIWINRQLLSSPTNSGVSSLLGIGSVFNTIPTGGGGGTRGGFGGGQGTTLYNWRIGAPAVG